MPNQASSIMRLKRPAVSVVLMILFILSIAPSVLMAASLGDGCRKAGLVSRTGNSSLVCKRSGRSLKWAQVIPRAPGPVFGFGATYSSRYGISLWWSPPMNIGTSPISSYKLEFQTMSTPWLPLPSMLSAKVTTTTIQNSELSGYTLRFRIAPVNSFGVGTFTESVWVHYSPSPDGGTASTTSPSPQTSITSSTSTITIPRTTTTQLQTTTSVSSRTVSQSNAVKTAASYLRSSSFSRTGLIRQLQFEGFSNSEATYGVDAQNADWNAQAAKTAASYLKISSFSRSALINQLVFEGFTSTEAEYGVSTTGL